MGNICGKQEPDNFSQPGRVLGTAPPAQEPQKSKVPKTVYNERRTLGGSSAPRDDHDAQRNAADAAEERRKSARNKKGPLQDKLNKQKQQTRADTLREVSDQARRERDVQQLADERRNM